MKAVSRILLPLFILLCFVTTSSAAIVHMMEFTQKINERSGGLEPGLPDVYGSLMVYYDKEPEVAYLNVAARIPGMPGGSVWLVSNMALWSLEMGPPQSEIAMVLDLGTLGVEYGMPVNEIQFAWEVTPMPKTEEEGEIWTQATPLTEMQPVIPRIVDAHGSKQIIIPPDLTWEEPVGPIRDPFTPTDPWHEVWSTIGCFMSNVELDSIANAHDVAGCVPAATANSMTWLKGKHDEIDFPEDLRKTYEQLSHLMNRAAGKGVTTEDLARAKLDFIEAHNLPIKVKIQNYFSNGNVASSSGHSVAHDTDGGPEGTWPSQDWIFSETQDEEDVEIMFGYWYRKADGTWGRDGGHAVTLSGAGKVFGVPYIDFKHDETQSGPGGTIEERGYLTPASNGATEIGGQGGSWKHPPDTTVYKHHAFIDGVVSESHEDSTPPVPATETFGGYCEEFVRVIPPGKTLEMAFPESTWWSRGVTVYTRDRSGNPARDVKHREWNNNDGKTRKISNTDTTKTLTVVVHCDDRQPWRPGYSPWSVGLNIVNNTSKDTTPGNPDDGGGFSMGWSDGSNAEFRPIASPSLMVATNQGADLSLMPGWLGVTNGCQELILTRQIPVWNDLWREVGLIVDVAELSQPGTLFVECPHTGTAEPITITSTGRYEILLGTMLPAPDFMIRLVPGNGLEMALDCVGVPSMRDYTSHADGEGDLPMQPLIRSVYPNPFNPMTAIHFALPAAAEVDLLIYDLQGRRTATVFSGALEAGEHAKIWRGLDDEGRAVAAGTYLVRMRAGDITVNSKVTLVK